MQDQNKAKEVLCYLLQVIQKNTAKFCIALAKNF